MDGSNLIIGTGNNLKKVKEHPYIGKCAISPPDFKTNITATILDELNLNRENSRGGNVEVDYYFEVENTGKPMEGLKKAAKMLLEHGTLKPWHSEGDVNTTKPAEYDEYMSWATNISLLGYNGQENIEAGIVTIAYPLVFFDKTDNETFPLTQLLMSIASEPFSAFSFYRGARIIDVRYQDSLKRKFPGIKWSHKRIRNYLNLDESKPIIGTIVKPKTGLTPELFSRAVVEAALAGAKFTKADENMHLTLKDIPRFIERTVKDLQREGFDMDRNSESPKGPRFLFAPHITAQPEDMIDYAKAAVESGANALMFSPYYGGGFQKLAEIVEKYDIPVYAHTAGMNVYTGAPNWGIDPSVMYRFAACYGAAFMQLTAVNGYLKPDDVEKKYILEKLKNEKLEGNDGMTLVIAGGIGAKNIGINVKTLGSEGRMFLAGTSVYSHPDGASAGVKSIILAYRAYCESGIVDVDGLVEYGKSNGKEGQYLINALR